MKVTKVQLLTHIFLIIAFLSLPYIFAPNGFPGFAELRSNAHERTNLAAYLLMVIFFYVNYYILIPRFYFKKKYLPYTVCIAGCFFAITMFVHTLDRKPPMRRPPFRESPPPMPGHKEKPPGAFEDSQTLFIFLVGLVASFALKINDRLERSEQEKLHTELSYLKAQINPHFLFNTLNSIYSLAIEKSDRTADAVVMLSSLMRYVIRDASENLVPLMKELEYIRNYVSLQKFRLDDTVQIDFLITGATSNYQIAPLILISFIENAFKYGVNPEQMSIILISVAINDQNLDLHVENKKVRKSRQEEDSTGGIGIENTKTRLHLLYPEKHQLTISDTDEHFTIDLNLTLT